MPRQMKEKNTTRSRLIHLYVLLAGISFLICQFTFLFSFVYSSRYKATIEQMTGLNKFYENLDLGMDNFLIYIWHEDITYYEKSWEYMNSLEEQARNLQESEDNIRIRRELQYITEMMAYLQTWIQEVGDDMEQYLDNRTGSFLEINAKCEKANEIYTAINSDYRKISQMMVKDIRQSYQKMQQKTSIFTGILFILFGGSFGILLWQLQKISKAVSQPIDVLIRKAERVRGGDLEEGGCIVLPNDSDPDICVLAEVFGAMVQQVRKQIATLEENVRVRCELEISRFKELQMQINPHYLFNTLNMIMETAYLENAEETVSLLQSAANLFRFSLDFSGKTISLFREIEELGNYIYLQEKRFGERIEFQFELDEQFHDMMVPSLILQPLVENAITHGIGMYTQNAKIWVRTVFVPEERLGYLIVEDNGEGMDEVKLAEVRKNVEEYVGQSVKIGLGNVWLRIKMFFGKQAFLKIESRKTMGTRIIIGLPYEKEEQHVSSDHRR